MTESVRERDRRSQEEEGRRKEIEGIGIVKCKDDELRTKDERKDRRGRRMAGTELSYGSWEKRRFKWRIDGRRS